MSYRLKTVDWRLVTTLWQPRLREMHAVDEVTIDRHLPVEVRAAAAPGIARHADDLAFDDALPARDMNLRQVAVGGVHAVTMIDDHQIAANIQPSREGHFAAGGGHYRDSQRGADVPAGVPRLQRAVEVAERAEGRSQCGVEDGHLEALVIPQALVSQAAEDAFQTG